MDNEIRIAMFGDVIDSNRELSFKFSDIIINRLNIVDKSIIILCSDLSSVDCIGQEYAESRNYKFKLYKESSDKSTFRSFNSDVIDDCDFAIIFGNEENINTKSVIDILKRSNKQYYICTDLME